MQWRLPADLIRAISRLGRIVVPGLPHHVTHTGNRREDVFRLPLDREEHLKLLRV